MSNQTEIKSPAWIDHFFRVAIALALGAVLFAAFRGWKQEHAHHADMISDITGWEARERTL